MRLEDTVNYLKTNCFVCNHLTQGWTGNIWPITPRVEKSLWHCYVDLAIPNTVRVKKYKDIYICTGHWLDLEVNWIQNAQIEVDEYRAWTNWIEAVEEGKDLRRSRSNDGP